MTRAIRPLLLGMGWFPDETGGLNRYFRGLLEALAERGEDARAVVVGPATDAPGFVVAAARTDDSLLRRVRAFARAARREGAHADVVHAHFALYAFLPVVLGPLRRKPLVLQFQGPWADEALAAGRRRGGHGVRRIVERSVYRRAQAAVVLSSAFRRILVERYDVPPWDVVVVPPGVALDVYSPGDRAAARAALELPDEAFVAVAARRLVPRMGLHLLVDAWREVRDAHPDAVLLVAGDGSERARLERIAGDGVRFLGNLGDDRLPVAYRAGDVSVVPSVELEGFGIVTLESLACGTPVITTDVGGLPEVVAPFDESLVVPRNDVRALARRLRAAADGALPSREAARAYAERYTWKRAAEQHAAVYRRVLSPPAERPLRVVYVDHCAQLGGAEIALLRLLRALTGVQAHVVLGEDGPLAQRLARAGISHEVLPFSQTRARRDAIGVAAALRSLPYTLRLARRLRAFRPDLVHTNSLKSALYGGAAARLARIPCVWHVRDRIADDYLQPRTVRAVRAAATRLPAAVIANSAATAATLPHPERAVVVASPVELETAPAPRTGPLRVGIVGRLAPWKGQDLFLEAFARAFEGTAAQAVVVGEALFGEDDYARELRALAARLDLDGRVEFTGFADDVGRELSRLDVLVHASRLPEPFGLAVVEGMAAGVAVVAAGAGGPAEVITDRVDGLLYPPGDVGALARLLTELAGDDGLRARLGEAARTRAAEFAPSTIAAQVLDVYRSVLE